MRPEVSFISPVYLGERSIGEFTEELVRAAESCTRSFEIVLVDDGSPDRSWQKILEVSSADRRIKGVKLSRNFGQHYAITAGLEAASGGCAIVMDCDMQDDPKYLPEMLQQFRSGKDIVYTIKARREHSLLKNLLAGAFYLVFNFLIENKRATAKSEVGSFSLLSRKAIDAFLSFGDYHRHYLMVVRLLGFSEGQVMVDHRPRRYGRSTYTFGRLMKHAINGIASQSNRLLHVAIGAGLAFFVASLLSTFILIIAWWKHGFLQGWTSVMVAILLSTGCILLCLGVVGVYLGKVFDQVRGRPLYIVDTKVGFDEVAARKDLRA